MNNAEEVEFVLIYGECQHNTCLATRTYAKRFTERYHPPHNCVLRLLQGLNRGGRFICHNRFYSLVGIYCVVHES